MDAKTLIGIIIKHLLCRLSEKFSDSVFLASITRFVLFILHLVGMLVFGSALIEYQVVWYDPV